MTTYEPEVEFLLREVFGRSKSLSFDEAVTTVLMTMSRLFQHNGAEIQSLLPDIMAVCNAPAEQAIHVVLNAHTQMLTEICYMFRGADLYVQDKNLITALLNTDLRTIVNEVQLPYDYCHFVFPDTMPLGYEDYEITGCLLVADMHAALTECRKSGIKNKLEGVEKAVPDYHGAKGPMGFFTRLRRRGVNDRDGVTWLRFSSEDPLDTLKNSDPEMPKLPTSDSEAARRMAYLCLGLCLYLQTEEGLNALQPVQFPPRHQGHAPCVGRLRKRRVHMLIRDLITPKLLREEQQAAEDPSYEVRPHLRRLHLRALRDEKFKRNPNGSVRMIWIKPTIVHREKYNEPRPQRAV